MGSKPSPGYPTLYRPQVAAQEQILSAPTLQVYIDGRLYLQEAGYFSLDLLLDKLDHYWELRQDRP